MRDFHVCIDCEPPHVDNCPKCFGWGFHHNGVPITAEEVNPEMDFVMCFECFGEPTNEDVFTFWGDPRKPKPVGILKANDIIDITE